MFFFGRLHKRMVQPIDFLGPKMCQILQAKFPRPFEQYSTHLPSLTPYSILLQFVSIPTRAQLQRWLPWSWAFSPRTGTGRAVGQTQHSRGEAHWLCWALLCLFSGWAISLRTAALHTSSSI